MTQQDDLEQLGLDGFGIDHDRVLTQVVGAHFPQGRRGLSEEADKKYVVEELPKEVQKNQSILADKMMLQNFQKNGLSFHSDEVLDESLRSVSTRVSLSYENLDGIAGLSNKNLTVFDREVMDAVATLAQYMDVMSAATIYRTITGKSNQSVNRTQAAKVEESMEKCRACVVKIDKDHDFKDISGPLTFDGNLIAFERISAQGPRGRIACFRILSTPPLFQFAESINKVSHFPLKLLDTPVSKTDSIISLQSQLLRVIDRMIKGLRSDTLLPWDEVYQMAGRGDAPRQYKAKTRKIVLEILDYWVQHQFFHSYEAETRSKDAGVIICI